MVDLFDVAQRTHWQEAERRDLFLRGLGKASGWKATRSVVEAERVELGVGQSTLY
jgi:hypothetical protein